MEHINTVVRQRSRLMRVTFLTFVILSSGLLVFGDSIGSGSRVDAAGIADNDWLGIVNAYRAQSGLDPVAENSSYSAGARNHSCWMLQNGIAHDEAPGTPGYTASGDAAGNASNVAVSGNTTASARYFVDLWMTAPFHAVGLLRNSLQTTGFGTCSDPASSSWKSAGTLDVIRGNDWSIPDPTTPVVFPGDGATTRLTRFIAESPDPRSFCGWNGSRVGLPLIALMPSGVSSASATLTGPDGPIGTCVLHQGNTNGVAKSILGGDNAVVVLPAAPLATGAHTVSVASNGGTANWTFNVDPNAPLTVGAESPPAPPEELPQLRDTALLGEKEGLTTIAPFRFADSRLDQTVGRLEAGKTVRLKVAGTQGIPPEASSISANFTVDRASGAGYLTASDCGGSAHEVSTLNYGLLAPVANHSIVPLSPDGDLCLFSHRSTDIIIDINGYSTQSGASNLVPIVPTRLVDTRASSGLVAGETRSFSMTGTGSPIPDGAEAVVINLTVADPKAPGWLAAYPCDVKRPWVSSVNVSHDTRANAAIVPTSADGTICVYSTTTTHVVIDVTGWLGSTGQYQFAPLRPIRVTDTRSTHPDLSGGSAGQRLGPDDVLRVPIAGVRGVPADAKVATLNVTATAAAGSGFLRVVPCSTDRNTSTVNFSGGADVANSISVELGVEGDVCVTSSTATHVLVDITGIWN